MKRIVLLVFGSLLGLLGLISILTSIALMTISLSQIKSDIDDPVGQIYVIIVLFVIVEIFLAFGIASSLLGLRCILGPRDWILRITSKFWSKAVKYSLVLPFLGILFAIISLLVKELIS